jgi:hypothetical protein
VHDGPALGIQEIQIVFTGGKTADLGTHTPAQHGLKLKADNS